MADLYADLVEARAFYGGIDTTDHDVAILASLEVASRWVDDATGRRFSRLTETRRFPCWDHRSVWVAPGLLSVSEVRTDDAWTGAYATVWASTDWTLWPAYAGNDSRPFERLDVARAGTRSFPVGDEAVEIEGVFGWPVGSVAVGAVGTGGVDSSATTLPLGTGNTVAVGQVLLVGTEQMRVAAVATGGISATVERGVNGTTAAAHAQGAGIVRYQVPGPVRQAVLMLGLAAWKSSETPFGVLGAPDFGSYTRTGRERDQAMALLAPYRIVEVR